MKKPQPNTNTEGLKWYRIHRHLNVRQVERFEGLFANDDDAIEAARVAHTGQIIGYDGKVLPYLGDDVDETDPVDLQWGIDRITSPHTIDNPDHGIIEAVTDGAMPLREGYVLSEEVYRVVEELSKLDPEWPLDRRRLISLHGEAKALMVRLMAMTEYE